MEKRGCFVFRPRSVLSVYSETSAPPSSAPCLPFRHSCSSFFPPPFRPCFIYPHLHLSSSLSLSLSFSFSSFLERAALSSCLRLLLQNWSKSRIRTPWSWRIEGYRTIGGRGRGWITRGANVTRTPLVVSFEPCFETISSMVSGLYRDIYRGEERFPCTGGFSRVSWWIGLKKKKEESFESIAITIVCQVACNYLFEYISSIFIYLFLRANWDF